MILAGGLLTLGMPFLNNYTPTSLRKGVTALATPGAHTPPAAKKAPVEPVAMK